MNVVLNFDLSAELTPWGSPQKRKRAECRDYLAFFAGRNPVCCVPGCGLPSTLDHVVAGRSRNSRADDWKVVNICLKHHLSKGGNRTFQEKFGVDFTKIISRNLIAYANSLGVTGVFNSLREYEEAVMGVRKTKRKRAA